MLTYDRGTRFWRFRARGYAFTDWRLSVEVDGVLYASDGGQVTVVAEVLARNLRTLPPELLITSSPSPTERVEADAYVISHPDR